MSKKEEAMEKEHNGSKWFVLRHDKCGAILTINRKDVAKSFSAFWDGEPLILACPNCGEIATDYKKLDGFFDAFEKLNKYLPNAGFTIKEQKGLG